MNYHEFPTERPNEERVANSIAHVVDQHYRPSEQDNQDKNTLRLCLVMPDGQRRSHILTIPRSYATYVLALLYRRFALALLLHHDQTFKIKPYKVWAVLAQNFIHVDNLWEKCIAASDNSKRIDAKTLSTILDRYIVTEAVVKRHEPVYVSEYRRRRTAQMPNVSQATLKDISESMQFYRCIELTSNRRIKIGLHTWTRLRSTRSGLVTTTDTLFPRKGRVETSWRRFSKRQGSGTTTPTDQPSVSTGRFVA